VSVSDHYFHRKDAKSAKLFNFFIKEFLCVLCVSAVKKTALSGRCPGR
jgi:hypothetical protein